ILNPPQDQKPVSLELRDKKLVVQARLDSSTEPVDLVTYNLDPELRPYLHPVKDPSGKVTLTQDRPGDHVWQHGIFTGLHNVNGVDFWTEKQGKQRFVKLLDVTQEQDRVGWRSLTEWVNPDGSIALEEEQAVTVYAVTSPYYYNMDFSWTLRSKGQEIKVGAHDYGGLAVRMDFNGENAHLNSNAERGRETATKRAKWCNVSRPFGDQTFGIVVYDHPQNMNHPPKWRVDDQGLINPSPSLQGEWNIPAGGSKTFHYRLTVHVGPGDAQYFDPGFEEFSKLKFTSVAQSTDGESVALWNPEWRVNAPEFEGTPKKLPEFEGKRNVLMTHPFTGEKAAALEREFLVPAGKKTKLSFNTAAHADGDWELRIYANNQLLRRQKITPDGERWKRIELDLTPFAGKKIPLRLENAADDWYFEFGFWNDLKIETTEISTAAAK
ncbi:MAG: PmoA family protein, partial [Verrucomicrobiota bacterium]|nr:PmoA family protein [Verrucomicrobiota bacterium]